MRIENTALLVERADWHATQDHVKQGTYGEGSANGEPEFQGCAIGCLATPHTVEELSAFIKSEVGEWGAGYVEYDDESGEAAVYHYDANLGNLLKLLESDFGICRNLARLAEAWFEGKSTHGDAINFIPAFARALAEVEGVEITDEDCLKFWADHVHEDYPEDSLGCSWIGPRSDQPFYVDTGVEEESREHVPPEELDRFLFDWIKSFKDAPVAA